MTGESQNIKRIHSVWIPVLIMVIVELSYMLSHIFPTSFNVLRLTSPQLTHPKLGEEPSLWFLLSFFVKTVKVRIGCPKVVNKWGFKVKEWNIDKKSWCVHPVFDKFCLLFIRILGLPLTSNLTLKTLHKE